VAFRLQREQALALQSVLKETGGAALGDKLVATLDGELLRRLASLQGDWMQQPLQGARADDFSGWQGEPFSVAQALGAGDTAAAPSLVRTAARLDLLTQQAGALLALGSPALATDPAAARWRQLRAELERYNARAADSSLLRLERYLVALGTGPAPRQLRGAARHEPAGRRARGRNRTAPPATALRAGTALPGSAHRCGPAAGARGHPVAVAAFRRAVRCPPSGAAAAPAVRSSSCGCPGGATRS
jgi:hypothetical protein